MAKASKEDIQHLTDFFDMMEEYHEYGTHTHGDEEPQEIDADQFADMLWAHWKRVECSWRRVVLGCEILIDNCCDPEASTLEWRKDLAELMEQNPA